MRNQKDFVLKKGDAADSDRIFDLVAVVVHCGSTPNRGHYITIGWLLHTVPKCILTISVKSHCYWLLFDDDIVDVILLMNNNYTFYIQKLDESSLEDFFGLSEVNAQKNSESAYILFYQQRTDG